MTSWRAPVIRTFDRYVKRMNIHDKVAAFHRYYALPQAERAAIQEEKLVRLLKHAAIHVPYYRAVLSDVGVARSDSTIDLSRFSDIPILTKRMVRDNFEQLTSDDLAHRRWYYNATGGTTGVPLRCIQDMEFGSMGLASEYYHYELLGVCLGERVFKLWGSPHDVLQGSVGWRARLMSFVRNYHVLNSFGMTQDDMLRYAEMLRTRRPSLLIAYVESAYDLARFISKHRIDVPPMKGVITSAGTLLPAMRPEIEQSFHSEVFNRYGSREMANMAFDLPSHEALEVSTYTHVLELLDDQFEHCTMGQEGRIIVTGLDNYAMPLIRYQIGDDATAHSLTETPVLSTLTVRDLSGHFGDIIFRRDGTRVPPAFFRCAVGGLNYSECIDKVRIVQEDYDLLRIELVVSEELPAAETAEIRKLLQAGMGEDCRIEFDYVDDLLPNKSGKMQYVISNVERP